MIDRIGTVWDYFREYIPFVIKNDVRFSKWKHHKEMLDDPNMYLIPGFEPEKMIFDIGSQYGDWAILWARKFDVTVYAFEPLRQNIDEMENDIRLNKMERVIYPIKTLIGDGTPVDYKTDGNMAVYAKTGEFNYNTRSIDDFVGIYKEIPDLMKIDVEGFEYDVLVGAIRTIGIYHPKIILETHSSELREKCDEFLKNLDYDLIHKGREIKGSGWMNEVVNLFYAYRGI
jgi:FkbM family methyltransferase